MRQCRCHCRCHCRWTRPCSSPRPEGSAESSLDNCNRPFKTTILLLLLLPLLLLPLQQQQLLRHRPRRYRLPISATSTRTSNTLTWQPIPQSSCCLTKSPSCLSLSSIAWRFRHIIDTLTHSTNTHYHPSSITSVHIPATNKRLHTLPPLINNLCSYTSNQQASTHITTPHQQLLFIYQQPTNVYTHYHSLSNAYVHIPATNQCLHTLPPLINNLGYV